MTRLGPADGDREVLSHGFDQAPRPAVPLLVGVGVAAAALAAGVVLGARTGSRSAAEDQRGTSTPVAVGAVDLLAGPWDEPVFRVPVLNTGDERVEATLVELRGWAPRPRNATAATIAPGVWGEVRFSARPDCASPPADVDTVLLRVATGVRRYDRVVALPGEAAALVDYHAAVCALRVPVRPHQLVGEWLVEKVHGRWRSVEGRQRIRFEDDGTFLAIPGGHRLTGVGKVWGRYRLAGSLLTTETEVAYGDACRPGEKATWRATSYPDARLHLAFLRGPGCPDAPGEVWVARRLLAHPPGDAAR